jgi:O-antigen ligase
LTGFFQSLFNRKGLRATGFLVLLLALIYRLDLLPEPIDSRIRELSRIEYQINAQNLEDFSGVTIRLAEWKGALYAIKNEPLLGHGPGLGHFALMNAYDKLGFQVGRRFEFNAHNQYLQTALDLGWPGTLLMILSVLAIAYPYGSTRNRLVLWFLVFFLLSSITESTLLRQRGAVMLALYLPLFGFIAPKKVGNQA